MPILEQLENISVYVMNPEFKFKFVAGFDLDKKQHDGSFIGKSFVECFKDIPQTIYIAQQMHWYKIMGGEMDVIEFRYKNRYYAQYGFPIFQEAQIQGSISIMIDFDRSIKRKKALIEINEMLMQAVNHLAHDIRGPIATMLGLVAIWRLDKQRTVWQKVKDFIFKKKIITDEFVIERIYERLVVVDKKLRAMNQHIEKIEEKSQEK